MVVSHRLGPPRGYYVPKKMIGTAAAPSAVRHVGSANVHLNYTSGGRRVSKSESEYFTAVFSGSEPLCFAFV
jgi:hypothetical protein